MIIITKEEAVERVSKHNTVGVVFNNPEAKFDSPFCQKVLLSKLNDLTAQEYLDVINDEQSIFFRVK